MYSGSFLVMEYIMATLYITAESSQLKIFPPVSFIFCGPGQDAI